MKIIVLHVDYRPRKEKIKSYSKIAFKLSLFTLLLIQGGAANAFKTGNMYQLLSGFYNAIP